MSYIINQYNVLKQHITKQTQEAISIVCVSKYSTLEEMQQLASLNEPLIFGESKLQVAQEKIPYFKNTKHLSWHMIGHLQRNKAKVAVELFDVIQSVDSIKLATSLNKYASETQKVQEIYLQVNMSEEPQKYGVLPHQKDTVLAELLTLKNLKVSGIMVMAEQTQEKSAIEACFNKTYTWYSKIKQEIPSIKQLSMGMSYDYPIAIACGATMIRCGSIIFKDQSSTKD